MENTYLSTSIYCIVCSPSCKRQCLGFAELSPLGGEACDSSQIFLHYNSFYIQRMYISLCFSEHNRNRQEVVRLGTFSSLHFQTAVCSKEAQSWLLLRAMVPMQCYSECSCLSFCRPCLSASALSNNGKFPLAPCKNTTSFFQI